MTKQNELIPFEQYLRKQNLSENTVTSYLWTIRYYTENYEDFSKENLLAYKGWLVEYFKPKTVNLRIQAINKYLVFIGKDKMQLKQVKVQQKNFLEKFNDISLLADLMGHESIETTRIYLRRTASEQQEIVDEVVTW